MTATHFHYTLITLIRNGTSFTVSKEYKLHIRLELVRKVQDEGSHD